MAGRDPKFDAQRLEELDGSRRLGNKTKAATRIEDLAGLLQLPDRLKIDDVALSTSPVVITNHSTPLVTVNTMSWTDIGVAASIDVASGGVEIDADVACYMQPGNQATVFFGLRLVRGASDVIFNPSIANSDKPYAYGARGGVMTSVVRFPAFYDATPGVGTISYRLQAALGAKVGTEEVYFNLNDTTNPASTMTLRQTRANLEAMAADLKTLHLRLLSVTNALRGKLGRL